MSHEKTEEYVYISSTGNRYHPEPTIRAKTKMALQEAKVKGFKPSKSYIESLNKLT